MKTLPKSKCRTNTNLTYSKQKKKFTHEIGRKRLKICSSNVEYLDSFFLERERVEFRCSTFGFIYAQKIGIHVRINCFMQPQMCNLFGY